MSTVTPTSELYIGLMSGTSLDSIDAGLFDLQQQQCKLINTYEHTIPEALRKELINLCQPGENEIERMGVADRALGKEFAIAVNTLLKNCNINKSDVVAIGSHGQTIRHHPNINNGFTLQIGDPNTIVFETGITTIADFRRRDIAASGQGAPLAPAFHRAAFYNDQLNRAVINIGGMANITFLPKDGETLGFDTGPGNILMDGWIQTNQQQKYDHNGQWAASGRVNQSLLKQLLNHPYLEKSIPKSTGREEFNIEWLHQQTVNLQLAPEDIQASLLEFTAQTIVRDIAKLPQTVDEIFICGGGASNNQLMQRLRELLPCKVSNTADIGIDAQWVEAAAFAWLAQQTLKSEPGNLASVTGASEEVILGAIYPVRGHPVKESL